MRNWRWLNRCIDTMVKAFQLINERHYLFEQAGGLK